MRGGAPLPESLPQFLGHTASKDYLAIFLVIFAFFLSGYLLSSLFNNKKTSVFSIGNLWHFKTKNIENWVEIEANVIRFDYANMEGGNPIGRKDLGNLEPEYFVLHGADPIVAVVEYKNNLNGKMTPVVIGMRGKNLKAGDIIRIKYNPENPLEAVLVTDES